jgi:hypothetical protein
MTDGKKSFQGENGSELLCFSSRAYEMTTQYLRKITSRPSVLSTTLMCGLFFPSHPL